MYTKICALHCFVWSAHFWSLKYVICVHSLSTLVVAAISSICIYIYSYFVTGQCAGITCYNCTYYWGNLGAVDRSACGNEGFDSESDIVTNQTCGGSCFVCGHATFNIGLCQIQN